MEGLTEIPEKMTAAEFEELYKRAVSRLLANKRRAVLEKLGPTVRAVAREESSLIFLGNSNGQKKN